MQRPRRGADDTAHLDPDVLAEFRAGLITGHRGARIGAHLVACDRCAALDDELAGVSALLAAAPAPAMPDSVAQRLDAALAAEVTKRNYAERADGNSSRKAGLPPRPAGSHGFHWRAWRVLAPAAVVVLLAAGGYELSQLGGGPATQAASSSAAQAASPANKAASSAGGSRAAVAAPFSGVAPTPQAQRRPAAFPVVIRPATVKQQVEVALRAPAAARRATSSSAAVRACVQAVTGGVKPVLVESVRYQDQPGTLIVVPARQGYTAWVAGAGCSATNRDLLAKTTVP